MRTAVLDLGTNVFNLLLADFSEAGCKYIKEVKSPARLGAGGLASGIISPGAFQTARLAMENLLGALREAGGADRVLALATSAVREAKNGPEFVRFLNSEFGIDVQVIPGEREAELIFKGIAESLAEEGITGKKDSSPAENILMMDIGGGSDEFIISDGESVLWKKSFPIGMARMREKFDYQEPVPQSVLQEFGEFCTRELEELWKQTARYAPSLFVGSSGSFDTFRDLLYGGRYKDRVAVKLPEERLSALNDLLVASTAQQRLEMPGMSPIRVDYIVLASVFTQLVLRRVAPRAVYQSAYSLKEGAMAEEYGKYRRDNGNRTEGD